MALCRLLDLRLAMAPLAAFLVFLLAACGSDAPPTVAPDAGPNTTPPSSQTDAPNPTATPAATATPTPVPTPTPDAEEQLNQLLVSVESKLANISTATFDMIDETESGAPFFGTTFRSLTGQVKSPESFWMLVKVVAPGFGFVEIEMTAVGEEAFIKFSEDAPWTPLPLDQVPFNFGEIGPQLSRLVPALSDVSLIGPESVGDIPNIGFKGNITSEGMSGLITGVDPGHSITLTFWVDENEHSLRQLRIAGRLFNGDGPETIRLLDITSVNVDVDIQLPDPSARQ